MLPASAASPVVELAERVAIEALARSDRDPVAPTLLGATVGGALVALELERLGAPLRGWSSRDGLVRAARALPSARLGPGLWTGFSGLAWAWAHSSGGSCSARLREHLRDWLRRGGGDEYDLTDGLCGLLVLGIETGDGELLELTLKRLSALAARRPAGIAWRTPARRRTPHAPWSFDLGVAHGVPGVAGALASMIERYEPLPMAVELLREVSDWIWAQRLPNGSRSRFPRGTEDDGRPGEPARLAWCYGDAGVLVVLARAARALGDRERLAAVGGLARQAAARPAAGTGVVDAGLCHGAAGVGHLFGRMYALTGELSCATAARQWLQRALTLRQPVSDGGNFPAWRGRRSGGGSFEPNLSLLAGATGAALALLSGVSSREPTWDRVLLAS